MSLVVNHNLMAANVARNLNAHYANLSNSTQRLSTGLRINSAADDAAGLAIRELQRADIAALQQGARNANDAISLIQVADGALQIIDEKLIRMKELAEQAATGTYDSTQRLMIESEYQAMASEITRIANATDFNGMKLLDGTLSADEHNGSKFDAEGKMKIHFGTGNDSAEDYYYIQIGEATSQAFGLGDGSTWEDAQNRIVRSFQTSLKEQMKAWQESGEYTAEELESIKNASATWVENFEEQLTNFTTFTNATELSSLYNKFKDDSEVAALSDLFKESIDNFDSVTYREQNKMQYALGHAALRNPELFTFENYTPATDIYAAVTAAQDAVTAGVTSATAAKAAIDAAVTASAAADAAQTAITAANGFGQVLPKVVDAVEASKSFIATNLAQSTPVLSYTYNDGPDSYAITYTSSGHISSVAATVGGTAYTVSCDGLGEYTNFSASNVTTIASGGNTYSVNVQDGVMSISNSNKVFTLDSDGNVVSMADGSDSYTVNSNGFITTMQDGSGNIISFDGTGTISSANVTSLKNSDGEIFTLTEDTLVSPSVGVITSMVDKDGYHISGSNVTAATTVTSVVDTGGNVYRLTNGSVTSVDYGGKTYTVDLTTVPTAPTVSDTSTGNVYTFSAGGTLYAAVDSAGNSIMAETLASDGLLKEMFADATAEAESRDYAGFTIATQEDAQKSLAAITNAIVVKDKIRANLGSLQNRLENTISNINIQAENLQAAESRISDVDVSTEMTEFVRQQILTQSAVAMLSQANSLPQMAMQLIGG